MDKPTGIGTNLTIKDIAKLAGVSPGTVSKIINNYSGISEETKNKVLKIIDETDYHPTFSAKTLATKNTNLIGLIYAGKINAEFNHPFFNEVVNTFKKAIGKLGYDILMFSNETFKDNRVDYLGRCLHFNVDGCLIISGEEVEDAIRELDKSNIPCVGIDLMLSGKNSRYVMTDNMQAMDLAVDYLYEKGLCKLAFIGGQSTSIITNIREQGFRTALAKRGLEIRLEWIQYGDYFFDSGYEKMKEILNSGSIPEAVCTASDLMAFGAIKAIQENGLKVSEDVKVIGYDDILASRYTYPPLTTISQDKEKIGRIAAYMLHDLIHERGKYDSSFLISPELIVRGSA